MMSPSARTDESSEVLSRAELRLLAEIGFMACTTRHARQAHAIFEGLNLLRPGHASVVIGLAMVSMCKGQFEDAVRVLREDGLHKHPHDEDVQLMLGIALLEAKRTTEGQKVLQALATAPGPSTPPRRVATALAQPQGQTPLQTLQPQSIATGGIASHAFRPNRI
ncbi:M48 family metallopeptidase [Variovorax sp. KK3]|uniref:tetratricopeptide repeat protein n=1 Tax=Variovorax sp. KK3 TaxID=1855728 RepID=UPI00097C5E2C|nr:tetratricopeptide repeat protein [Variovorax sp. KK3]